MNMIKKIFNGIINSFKVAYKLVMNKIKEVIINAPAVSIMVTSAIGISTIATGMNAHNLITVSWLNPTLTIYFLSATLVVMLAEIAGRTAN